MKVSFEKIDTDNEKHFDAFRCWHNESLMFRNWRRHGEEDVNLSEYKREEFKSWIDENPNETYNFLIVLNDIPVGYGWFAVNFHVAMTKADRVAWPSIAIGTQENRNKGLGLEVCKYLYKLAKEKECTHIEAAVFEFNDPMISILEKNHFKYIGDRDKVTFLDGKWWNAKHYLLEL